jgi:hypothetical protein
MASVASRAKTPRQGREDVTRVMTVEAPKAAPLASKSQHETILATTVASLVIGPRIVDSHDAARPTSCRRRRNSSRLCSLPCELPPAAPPAAALFHLDEPKAHTLLGDSSDNDKIDGWCLDTGATHHMTGRPEFFSELDSGVRGTIKFGDASIVEIKGVGSIVFVTKTGEHRLLTSVYYIPALRNSIISLG